MRINSFIAMLAMGQAASAQGSSSSDLPMSMNPGGPMLPAPSPSSSENIIPVPSPSPAPSSVLPSRGPSPVGPSSNVAPSGQPGPTSNNPPSRSTGSVPTNRPTSRSSTRSTTTRRTTTRTTSTSTIASTVPGLETISIINALTVTGPRKRQIAVSTQLASIAVCPVYNRVPNQPCYPCVVGTPTGQQSLLVQTTSTVGQPQATPVFAYSFARGAQGSVVTTPVPGYTPLTSGSRNFQTCLVIPGSSGSVTPTPTPTPTPVPNGGVTTNIFVTATIYNLIEIISICPTNGATVTIVEQSTTCQTYSTCVTIPAELCTTYESTQDNGVITTYVTPVPTWTQILTTAVTSTVQTVTATASAQAVAPPGYTPVVTKTAAAVAPQKTYVQSGAEKVAVPVAALLVSLLALAL